MVAGGTMRQDLKGIPKEPAVYSITNTINGKVYVGSCMNAYMRLMGHRQRLKRGGSDNKALQADWVASGEGVFLFAVLELCPADLRRQREQHWMDTLGAHTAGYNSCPSSTSVAGRVWTEEDRHANSEGQKRRFSRPEELEKLKASRKEKMTDPEARRRVSEGVKRHNADPDYRAAQSLKAKAAHARNLLIGQDRKSLNKARYLEFVRQEREQAILENLERQEKRIKQ